MAKDEKDLEGDEAKGGGKKKLLIIIAAGVLLLLVGVGAALALLGGGDDPADAAASAESAPVVLPDPIYFEFKPRFVVNLPPGGRARMLQVELQVMSREQAVIDYVNHNSPMLRHHLFNLFSAQQPAPLYTREGREALAEAAKQRLDTLLKDNGFDGKVEAVYFTELVLQ